MLEIKGLFFLFKQKTKLFYSLKITELTYNKRLSKNNRVVQRAVFSKERLLCFNLTHAGNNEQEAK